MSRINTNVQSLIAQRVLGNNNMGLNKSLERLSTGLRINRGKDDPAGLIASENLRSELKATNTAISNAERSDQVVNIAEGGLQEVSNLLTDLQGLITASASEAGLSEAEKQANQLQIDSILQTIDRVSGATSFQGIKLLNGNFDYKVSSVATGVSDYRINAAKFEGSKLDVNVLVTQSAQQAGLYLSLGGTALDLTSAAAALTLEIGGIKGSRELTFSSGTALSTMAKTINNFKEITGVSAAVKASGAGTNGLVLASSEYGSAEFVSVKVVNAGGLTAASSGLYNTTASDFDVINTTETAEFGSTAAQNGIRDNGQDIQATINGIKAVSQGKSIKINADFLDVEMTLNKATAQTVGNTQAFSITGGGADFQLGAKVDISGKVSLGIQDVAARKLGKTETATAGTFQSLSDLAAGKTLNVVSGDLTSAQKVVGKAIEQVSSLRGRLGAFQKNTVGATIRSLGISAENTAAAESLIRDSDFATETAGLTRSQILVQASTNVLALANSQPQSVLSLLG
jgi:flagellin